MKFDLHIHTKYSKCSNLEPSTVLKKAKKIGLDGIGVVDHNSFQGAIKTAKLNKDKNFKVLKGIEFETEYCHLLALDLNEEIKKTDFYGVIDKIKSQGALLIVAHPYASFRGNLKIDINKIKNNINALETYNSRALFSFENDRAKNLALKLKLPQVAGSDAHFSFEIGNAYTQFQGDLRSALKKRKTTAFGSNKTAFFAMSLSKINKILR